MSTYRIEERSSTPAPKITVCRIPSFDIDFEASEAFFDHNLTSFIEDFGTPLGYVMQSCSIKGISCLEGPKYLKKARANDVHHTKGKRGKIKRLEMLHMLKSDVNARFLLVSEAK